MSELVRGSPMPLFDRLSSLQSAAGAHSQLISPEQLDRSIGRELLRLLNTRSSLTFSEFSGSTGTAIDYGIPDISALFPNSRPDLERLQNAVRQAIVHYEPRLKDVTVKAFPPISGSRSASLLIGGKVTVDMKFRQLNFQIQLDQRSGDKVNAS